MMRRASSPLRAQCQCEGMNSQHLPSFSLDGKIVVVTGASRGIGRGLVDALAAAGATVALTARSSDEASTIAAQVVAAGGRASGHVMDVADVGSINAAFDDIAQQHGRVDVLVANAGLGANHPAVDVT
jgi:NAD(P)-dependent dehydrogenase (short-subunit alcohol dehydrogenase family)